jgi:hypothetical protein
MDLKFKPDSSGLVPATHEHALFPESALLPNRTAQRWRSWVAGTSPAMTNLEVIRDV